MKSNHSDQPYRNAVFNIIKIKKNLGLNASRQTYILDKISFPKNCLAKFGLKQKHDNSKGNS